MKTDQTAITAARTAFSESGANNDAFKRLMIVPKCHIKRLVTRTYTLDQVNEAYADLLAGRIIRGVIEF